jgi:hypothetical protein
MEGEIKEDQNPGVGRMGSTTFSYVLQNYKIDVYIAMEKTHNHADRIHWAI